MPIERVSSEKPVLFKSSNSSRSRQLVVAGQNPLPARLPLIREVSGVVAAQAALPIPLPRQVQCRFLFLRH